MSDGKAAVLRAPFLLPSGSSCCPAMPAPASLPRSSPACLTPKDRRLCHLDLAHRCGAELEPQAAPGANSLPAAEAPLPFPRCLRGWTQPARCSVQAASQPRQKRHFLNFSPLPLPHWPPDFVTDVLSLSLILSLKEATLGCSQGWTPCTSPSINRGMYSVICTFLRLHCGPGKKSIM